MILILLLCHRGGGDEDCHTASLSTAAAAQNSRVACRQPVHWWCYVAARNWCGRVTGASCMAVVAVRIGQL